LPVLLDELEQAAGLCSPVTAPAPEIRRRCTSPIDDKLA
jgi:hypothetical protein